MHSSFGHLVQVTASATLKLGDLAIGNGDSTNYYCYLVITFMHGIYNYIPETNHVSRVYSVAAVLYVQFVLHVMLFRPWNMFCTFTFIIIIIIIIIINPGRESQVPTGYEVGWTLQLVWALWRREIRYTTGANWTMTSLSSIPQWSCFNSSLLVKYTVYEPPYYVVVSILLRRLLGSNIPALCSPRTSNCLCRACVTCPEFCIEDVTWTGMAQSV